MRADMPGGADVSERGFGRGEVCRESRRLECAERKRAGNREREAKPFHGVSLSRAVLERKKAGNAQRQRTRKTHEECCVLPDPGKTLILLKEHSAHLRMPLYTLG
jgi:hypothetical protein